MSRPYLQRGTARFHRANLALFVAGLVTFAVLYGVQPLLPTFASTFHLTPAGASLAISVTTGTLAVSLLVAGAASDVWGRGTVMKLSVASSAILAVLSAFSPSFPVLLMLRALEGVTLAGLPVAAMAYLSEEVHPESLGLAMGLYIGGNGIGGMLGRTLVAALSDALGWRAALAILGAACVLAAVLFWRVLPHSAHFTARPFVVRDLTASLAGHLKDPGLLYLYATGALLMASFVTLYNYIGFRLLAAPYHLSPTQVGSIFTVYLVGTASSTWMGRLADRYTRRRILWVCVALTLAGIGLTLSPSLALIVLRIAVVTFGFFGAHSVASSWVGRRAVTARAQASALYLFCYYLGSSAGGSAGGLAYGRFGWPGVVAMIAALLTAALAISARLSRLRPIAAATPPTARHPLAS